MDKKLTVAEIFAIKFAKYLFAPFFLSMLFAAILGRDGIKKYHLGEPNSMLEEYIALIVLFVAYDVGKYLFNFLKNNKKIK